MPRNAEQYKKNRGKAPRLNVEWGVNALDVRYSETGHFYFLPSQFPAALFDPYGYVVFATEEAYRSSPYLRIGKRLWVPKLISTIPGYVRVVGSFADQFSLVTDPDDAVNTYTRNGKVYKRKESVRISVLNRANGKCEYCNCPGFKTKDGNTFLETHHIEFLEEGGRDNESNVAALCPNHHREAHHGEIAARIQKELLAMIKSKVAK